MIPNYYEVRVDTRVFPTEETLADWALQFPSGQSLRGGPPPVSRWRAESTARRRLPARRRNPDGEARHG